MTHGPAILAPDPILMKRFYANLALGEDVGRALQHARRNVRERLGSDAVPYYWAPFTVVGEGPPANHSRRAIPKAESANILVI